MKSSVYSLNRRIKADWPAEFGGFVAIYLPGRIGLGDLWSWSSLFVVGLGWLGLALFERAYQRGELEAQP